MVRFLGLNSYLKQCMSILQNLKKLINNDQNNSMFNT